MDLKWQDTEDIAIRLVEEHPEADPLTIPPEQLLKMNVDLTIVGGKVVYERPRA